MADKRLFSSIRGKQVPPTDTRNHEGAPAYRFPPRHQLAQYAATGCLSSTFYASAGEQLATVLELCDQVEPSFIARSAVFARERGHMKDMPALLCAVLSVKEPELLVEVFDRVIDNGRMVRNFVQIIRSGVVGRKSLGTMPKRLVRQWLESRSDEALFRAAVGNTPSLADIIKMVHPKPANASREALYGYLIGRSPDRQALPELVRQYEEFKQEGTGELPGVPFQMLTQLQLTAAQWRQIALTAGWQMTRMNLNTFARHGVFEDRQVSELIAARLQDREMIAKARVLPYQLLTAAMQASDGVPHVVREALVQAMETAVGNIPEVAGQVYVCPDVSGSMHSPVTGFRRGATTAVRCIDVAALVAAGIVRHNPGAEVLPFEHRVVPLDLNADDCVLVNARKLASVGGGGTSCSAPLQLLNRRQARGDLVVLVSDNESWVDAGNSRGSSLLREWNAFRARNRQARLVCLDIQPYGTTQAAEREDILNIGGFSDQVFKVIASFVSGELQAEHWVGVIEGVQL